MSTVNLSNSRKGRIALMVLAFAFVGLQWWLIIGMFDYMKLGTMIPNLLDSWFGRPLVDWLVWLLYGAFAVLIPLYFRVRGQQTMNTWGTLIIAAVSNIVVALLWYPTEYGYISFATGIVAMVMTVLLNTGLVGVLYALLIYKYFPD